jgi:predicted ATP-grasp superfamily ATP-dependent carboligase
MQHIFIYEYVTGGGMFSGPGFRARALRHEGRAMVTALADDFRRLTGRKVTLLRDAHVDDLHVPGCRQVTIRDGDQEREVFQRLAREADWTVVIAPEFDEALLTRCRWVEEVGGRLLSPPSDFVACAADKTRTAQRLSRAGVRVSEGITLVPGARLPDDFPYPAVLKPIDGAGSMGLQLIRDAASGYEAASLGTAARLERLCPGISASVAVLCGPGGGTALPACWQRLSDDGRFRYLGGRVPLGDDLCRRARTLALGAIESLPAAVGYVGVDLILGNAGDGSEDVVVEVNPRLTTSFIGLRRLVRENLAEAMVRVAAGDQFAWSQGRRHVEFDPAGRIRCDT